MLVMEEVGAAWAIEYLPREADKGLCKQPKRAKCVIVNTTKRSWRCQECFDIMVMQNSEFALLDLGPVFPHYASFSLLWNGVEYPVLLHVGCM